MSRRAGKIFESGTSFAREDSKIFPGRRQPQEVFRDALQKIW